MPSYDFAYNYPANSLARVYYKLNPSAKKIKTGRKAGYATS